MQRSLPGRPRPRLLFLIGALVLLLVFGRSICSLIIDYLWWREMGQVSTWLRAVVLSLRHERGGVADRLPGAVDRARSRDEVRGHQPARASACTRAWSPCGLAVVAMIVAAASMSGWVVARYAAGSGIASTWHDPVFGRSLASTSSSCRSTPEWWGSSKPLPSLAVLVYYLTARGWQIRREFPEFGRAGLDLGQPAGTGTPGNRHAASPDGAVSGRPRGEFLAGPV